MIRLKQKEFYLMAAEISKQNFLSKPWEKFFLRCQSFSSIPIEQWDFYHLLGYFDFLYFQHYQYKYAYSFNAAPSRCTEIVIIKKLFNMFDTTNFNLVKEYLDWVFEVKIKPRKYAMKKISFLLSSGFGNEFLSQRKKKEVISRDSLLPLNYQEIIEKYNLSSQIELKTYGQLSFLVEMLQANPDEESFSQHNIMLQELILNGLKLEMLKTLA